MFKLALFSFSSLHWIFDRDEDEDATRALVLARTKSESIPLFKQMAIQLSRTQEKYRNSHASSGQRAAGSPARAITSI